MKIKIVLVAASVMMLAASCNPFAKAPLGGIAKTTNGGTDWQFVNARVEGDNKVGSISGAKIGTMLVSQNNPRRVYAASYNGGVLYSDNAGESWQQILSNVNMYDIALDPDKSEHIFAAGSVGGRGRVLVTNDNGKSWQDTFTEATTENPVREIALNPNNSQQIYIGLQSGSLIKSTDGGTNWQLVQSFADRIQSINWHKDGTIFVLLRRQGLRMSIDGTTFTDASTDLTGDRAFDAFKDRVSTFVQLAVNEKNSSLLYVTTDQGMFKTDTKGASWTKLSVPSKEDVHTRAVALARSSDDVVYASVGPTIYKSTDGGKTFLTHSIATSGFINYIVVDPERSQVAFAGIVTE